MSPLPVLAAAVLLAAALAAADGEAPPARTWVVDQAAANADDTGLGDAAQPFRTIAAAAERAQAGDTVLVRPGVYRERVAPARGGEPGRPITYRAEPAGGAAVRGSVAWRPAWQDAGDGRWRAALDPALFPDGNPFLRTVSLGPVDRSVAARPAREPLPAVLGQLFVDGEPWEQVDGAAALAAERTWMVDAAGEAILLHPPAGADPAALLVEITVRAQVFAPRRRGLAHLAVQGFVFEQAANQGPFPQIGMISTRSGRDWLIEDCTIRHAATIGLDIGSEHWDGAQVAADDPADRRLILASGHVVRGNRVLANGLCGISGWNQRACRITGNLVEGNNRLAYPRGKGWEEWAGIKLHCSDALVSGNLVRDNRGFGIWIDAGHAGAEISGNAVLRNRGAGIFLELNRSPGRPCRVVGNLVADSYGSGFYPGFGVYAHDAADIEITGNLLTGNGGAGVLARVITQRQIAKQPCDASRIAVQGNLLIANRGAVALPWPGARAQGNRADGNLIAGDAEARRFRLTVAPDESLKGAAFADLSARLTAAGLAAPADEMAWIKAPLLDLAAWRAATGNDAASQEADVRIRLREDGLAVEVEAEGLPAGGGIGPEPLRGGRWRWTPAAAGAATAAPPR